MEVRRGCSHVRPTQAYRQFVEEPKENSLAKPEDRTPEQEFMTSAG
jgi:hypothetical protein